jgi:hypothetical protein
MVHEKYTGYMPILAAFIPSDSLDASLEIERKKMWNRPLCNIYIGHMEFSVRAFGFNKRNDRDTW